MLLSTGMPLSALRLGGAAVWGGPELVLTWTLVPKKLLLTIRLYSCVWCFLIVFKDRVKSLWA